MPGFAFGGAALCYCLSGDRRELESEQTCLSNISLAMSGTISSEV